MDPLRYPIGSFEPIPSPSSTQRTERIVAIHELPRLLRLTVQSLTEDQLGTPYRPGGWTVRQVVHHLGDNDMFAFLRFKRALTESKPKACTYEEASWAELADYRAPLEPSLVIMESVRSRFVALLHTMDTSDYERTFTSPTHGLMNLDIALQRFDWHGRHHLAQIDSLINRMGW